MQRVKVTRLWRWSVVVSTVLAVALALTMLLMAIAPIRAEHRTRLDNFDPFLGTLECGSVISPQDIIGTPAADCASALKARRAAMVVVATRILIGSLALASAVAFAQWIARAKRSYEVPG